MIGEKTRVRINKVKERILFLAPSVKLGHENEANLRDFEIGDLLGSGAFGSVYKVVHKVSKRVFALKVVRKDKIRKNKLESQIKNEVKIMYSLDNDYVVRIFNHFEDDENLYLVIEFAEEGQLMNKLKKSATKRLSESTAIGYVRDLVSALDYIHNLNPPIIHRDIKPENLLVTSSNRIKLGDFGWSNFQEELERNTFCGTPEYLAPEMINGSGHNEKLDIWCLGILMFELLAGKTPFLPRNASSQAEAEKILKSNIISGKIAFPSDYPSLARDLTNKILKPNPKDRISTKEIKRHPWFTSNGVSFEDLKLSVVKESPLEGSRNSSKTGTLASLASSVDPDGKTPGVSQEKPETFQVKKDVEFELEGKKVEDSEIVNQMPDLTDLEASTFFRRESVITATIPKLDKVKIQIIPDQNEPKSERKSINMMNNEMLGKMNEQLNMKDNKIRELQLQNQSIQIEKQRYKEELDRLKYSFSSNGTNGTPIFDDNSFSMDTRKLKMFEEEIVILKNKVEELYQVNISQEETIDSLKNRVDPL